MYYTTMPFECSQQALPIGYIYISAFTINCVFVQQTFETTFIQEVGGDG